jgi:hypothetical protein
MGVLLRRIAAFAVLTLFLSKQNFFIQPPSNPRKRLISRQGFIGFGVASD